jgi:aconitate hydratase 2/2-methylisocitrate dehydratase
MRKGATAVSTSTRNFPNRLGIDTNVFLASAELSAVAALLGRIPTMQEYLDQLGALNAHSHDVYRYMNFDKIKSFSEVADTVTV